MIITCPSSTIIPIYVWVKYAYNILFLYYTYILLHDCTGLNKINEVILFYSLKKPVYIGSSVRWEFGRTPLENHMSVVVFVKKFWPLSFFFSLGTLFFFFFLILFSHCTARGSGYPYMYTLQLQFFPPPFLLLQHEYLDIVLSFNLVLTYVGFFSYIIISHFTKVFKWCCSRLLTSS